MTPRSKRWVLLAIALLSAVSIRAASGAAPEVRDSRLVLSLFVSEPDIVTPIGIAVNPAGAVLALESHTHFPKTNYPGPKIDRVKMFRDLDGDGRAERVTIFHEGLHHGMNLAFGPDQRLYATHRNGLVRLDDADGDGQCEQRVDLLKMDTPGTYPHNGIGGIAFSADGWIYVGQGENLGEKFTLEGTDGRRISDREGGFIFRCRHDGSGLERVASGFWNPFGLAFYGRQFLLAVDNDPDSRPPNRLLDIVPGGDYGYKFRFGRSGLHPFQAWNGELPGTLPMITGVGEGSSAILACDRTSWPAASYRQAVLVTAGWDHRIEVYQPKPFGASLRAEREIVVEGDSNFRPIGMAAAPDGSVFFTDWVDVSYNVHGKGRIWRLSARDGKTKPGSPLVLKPGERARMDSVLTSQSLRRVLESLKEQDPFVVSAGITTLAQSAYREAAWQALGNSVPEIRLGALLALRRAAITNGADAAGPLLGDPDERVRLMAVIWAGEATMTSLAHRLSAALQAGGTTPALLRAHAATAQILAKASGTALVPSLAGRTDFSFTEAVDVNGAVRILERSGDRTPLSVRREAVQALTQTADEKGRALLRNLTRDRKAPASLRAEAAAALANTDSTTILLGLLADNDSEVRLAAGRALRAAAAERKVQEQFGRILTAGSLRKGELLQEELAYALELSGIAFSGTAGQTRPANVEEWRKELKADGNVERGRRVFLSPHAGCVRCHRVEDLGGRLGPDLSTIARGADREKLMQSILTPSRDIPPQFVAHTVETKGGETWTGLLLTQSKESGVTLATMEGKAVVIPAAEVTSHTQSQVSLMPEGLERAMTVAEFRDLLAYLLSRK